MQPSELPALDSTYALSEKTCANYRRDLHVCLRSVCSTEELSAYRSVINVAFEQQRQQLDVLPLDQRDTYGKAFIQIGSLGRYSNAVAQFVMARRFAGIAARLMGVASVRFYNDQVLYKEPGGGITPWHQDQYYWPLDTDNTITLWMPLTALSEQMGTLNFASASGAAGSLGDLPISDNSEANYRDYCQRKGFSMVNYGAMAAGDATFHSGWCLHGSLANTSSQLREVMSIIYFAANSRILPDPDSQNRWNEWRRRDHANFLPGTQAGEPAVSEFNPVVYP